MSNQSLRGRHLVYSLPALAGRDLSTPDLSFVRRLLVADTWARYLTGRQQPVALRTGIDGFAETVLGAAKSRSLPPDQLPEAEARIAAEVLERLQLLEDPQIEDGGTPEPGDDVQLSDASGGGVLSAGTDQPSLYRFTQWIFLRLLSRRLVKQVTSPRSVCTSCGRVFPIGAHQQCPDDGSALEEQDVTRWALEMGGYGDRLLNDIDKSQWGRADRAVQRNMLGRLRGVDVTFTLSRPFESEYSELTIFTTRVETVFGATFIALEPFHPLVDRLTDVIYADEVSRFRDRVRQGIEPEISGVRTGGFALNPANLQRIPVVISLLAKTPYSDGAVMGVPGHDRDLFSLAQLMNLTIREAVHNDQAKFDSQSRLVEPWLGDGVLTNSGTFTSLPLNVGRDRIVTFLGRRGICRRVTKFRFRQQLISGLSPWGAPVPVVHCESCGPVSLPDGDLPLEISVPRARALEVPHKGIDFGSDELEVECPACGGRARRDEQTILPWLGRAWYFLIQALPHLVGDVPGFRSLSGSSPESSATPNGDSAAGSEHNSAPSSDAAESEDEVDEAPTDEADASQIDLEGIDDDVFSNPVPQPDAPADEVNGPPQTAVASRLSESVVPVAPEAESDEDAVAIDDDALPLENDVSADSGLEANPDSSSADSGTNLAAAVEGETAVSVAKPPEKETQTASRRASRPRPFAIEEQPSPLPIGSSFGSPSQTVKEILSHRFLTKFLYDLQECPVYEPYSRFERVGRAWLVDSTGDVERSPMDVLKQWLAKYGADAVRLHVLFAGPLHRSIQIHEQGVRQMSRFVERIRQQVLQRKEKGKFVSARMLSSKHLLIDAMTCRMERWKFHTAVAALLRFVRYLGSPDTTIEEMDAASLQTFVLLLFPVAPQLAHELWVEVGQTSDVEKQEWPQASEELVRPPEKEFLILVNGKVRDRMTEEADAKAEKLESHALQRETIRELVGPRKISRVVVVPHRLVNIVLEKPSGED